MSQLPLPLPKGQLVTSAEWASGFKDGYSIRDMAEGINPHTEVGVHYMRGFKAGMIARGVKSEEIFETYEAVRTITGRAAEG